MRRVVFLSVMLAASAAAQTSAPAPAPAFDFSIRNIMRGPELYGRPPERVRWTADGQWIYFQWVAPGADWRETPKPYRVRAVPGARPERVTEAHVDTVAPLLERGVTSQDARYRAVAYQGDIYLIDTRTRATRRVTETTSIESDPAFSVNARQMFFVRDNNIFSFDIADGRLRQLTDIRSGAAPRDSARAVGQRAVLEAQQRELFEAVRDRLRQDSIARAEREAREARRTKPLYLAATERVNAISVSPNGQALLLSTSTPGEKARETEVPQFVTASGYTEQLRVRNKVGDAQNSGRVAYMRLPSGEITWLKVTPDDTTGPASFSTLIGWNDAGTSALVFSVSRDFKRRYLHRVDGATGALKTLDLLRDSAWVNGPCSGCAGWLEGGTRVWFVSEADGYAHLYSVAAGGGDRRQLTSGKWEVLDVEVSQDRRWFHLTTNEGSPFEQHFFRMPVAGGPREKITRAVGSHAVAVSPDGAWLADVHSTANQPPELYLMRLQAGAPMARLTTSPTAEWQSRQWIVPEIVWIPASDGVKVPARIYRPRDLGAQPNGAGVIFVHGAGYLHNVHNYWSTYSREYMFNQLLASRGYVVLDIDYRGSAGYGRDWRTAIYRHMGGRDLQDHVDGSKYLRTEFGIDPERVGIYGGSYGGFITLMALFTEPEHFGAGAALRSVTDWAHYNHPYTGRILNFPDTDTLAYRQSSPIYFAQGLEDPLLIAHGMVDVNVHFQDVVRLSQRLIELGKTDWEMAVYPVEDHGFVRPSSWTDEYRRIYELFERHIGAAREGAGARAAGAGSGPR